MLVYKQITHIQTLYIKSKTLLSVFLVLCVFQTVIWENATHKMCKNHRSNRCQHTTTMWAKQSWGKLDAVSKKKSFRTGLIQISSLDLGWLNTYTVSVLFTQLLASLIAVKECMLLFTTPPYPHSAFCILTIKRYAGASLADNQGPISPAPPAF